MLLNRTASGILLALAGFSVGCKQMPPSATARQVAARVVPASTPTDVTGLPNQVNNGPMIFASLHVIKGQTYELTSAQAAAKQNGQHGSVPLSFQTVCAWELPKVKSLSHGQPVPQSLELGDDIQREGLFLRYRLFVGETIDPDIKGRISFLENQARAEPRRRDGDSVVTHTTDGRLGNALQGFLRIVEPVCRSEASYRNVNADNNSLAAVSGIARLIPSTNGRVGRNETLTGSDRDTKDSAHLRLGEERTSVVRWCGRPTAFNGS